MHPWGGGFNRDSFSKWADPRRQGGRAAVCAWPHPTPTQPHPTPNNRRLLYENLLSKVLLAIISKNLGYGQGICPGHTPARIWTCGHFLNQDCFRGSKPSVDAFRACIGPVRLVFFIAPVRMRKCSTLQFSCRDRTFVCLLCCRHLSQTNMRKNTILLMHFHKYAHAYKIYNISIDILRVQFSKSDLLNSWSKYGIAVWKTLESNLAIIGKGRFEKTQEWWVLNLSDFEFGRTRQETNPEHSPVLLGLLFPISSLLLHSKMWF